MWDTVFFTLCLATCLVYSLNIICKYRELAKSQCSKRPNPLKLTLVGISRFSGALVGPSRGSRHMTSVLSFHM